MPKLKRATHGKKHIGAVKSGAFPDPSPWDVSV